MIWLYYLLCLATGAVLVSLDVLPWNSWQWWAIAVIVTGAYITGCYVGDKNKEENNNENR